MKDGLRIGILGAGSAGAAHAVAFDRLDNVKVVSIWSRSRSRAEGLVQKLGLSDVKVWDKWEEIVESGRIDAISIATPAALRIGPVMRAMEEGIHVLVEKPFSTGVSQANEMVNAAKNNKSVAAVCFNWRYSPGNQVARKIIQNGEIGKLRSLRIVWRLRWAGTDQEYESWLERRPWERSPDTGGGLLRHVASHEFDRMRFLAGIDFNRIASRISSARFRDSELPNACNLLVELVDGATAEVCVMTTKGQNERNAFVVGEEGSLFVTHESVVRQLRNDKEPVTVIIPDRDQPPQGVQLLQHTMNQIAEDFCEAVRTGGVIERSVRSLPSFIDGLHCQKVIAAAEKSDAEKRWVLNEELA